ncbi:cupredoxin domain-containing protein [Arthrobacter livingstonensis]|nr:cupredoxin domain-containing protein [Arthrobacter livingstonensis]
MNKQGNLIAATALAAMLGVGGCSMAVPAGTSQGSAAPAAAASAAPMPAMTASGDAMAGMIHIESGAYRDAAPVPAGSMVTVMNMDSAAYTVTSDDGSFTVKVPAGAMATFKAPGKPGSYPFHSDGGAGMHGVLTVR